MKRRPIPETVAEELRRLGVGARVKTSYVDGVVVLSGQVTDEPLRRQIEQRLLQLPEVQDVHNYLRIAPPRGDPRAQLCALLEGEDVRLPELVLRLEDGELTLLGRADSWFDSDAAERLAWTLPGVRQVINRLALPQDADARIGDQPQP